MTQSKQEELIRKARLLQAYTDTLDAAKVLETIINSEVTAALEELEKEAKLYSKYPDVNGKPKEWIPLSAIQTLKERYK